MITSSCLSIDFAHGWLVDCDQGKILLTKFSGFHLAYTQVKPLIVYTISLQYSATFGTSDSLLCAPISGPGLEIGETYKIGSNGFGPTFYMTNFCWDNMIDYPARSVNFTQHTNHPNGQIFQVRVVL